MSSVPSVVPSSAQDRLFRAWADDLAEPAARLTAFERWLATEIGTKLRWPADPARAQRQILQARAFVVEAVADLGRHGFLFQAAELAAHIDATIERIAAYQAAGQVSDLYAYFKSAWAGWVGRQAEELAREAMQKKAHASQRAAGHRPTIPELALRDLEARHEHVKTLRAFRTARIASRRRKGIADTTLPLGFD